MKMEANEEVFARYKEDYYKARIAAGSRTTLTSIIDTVKSFTGMERQSIIRALNHLQVKDPVSRNTEAGRYTIPPMSPPS